MIIPDDRVANWEGNVGVPGGIPSRVTIFCDLTQAPYNADPTGVVDAGPILEQAIIDCPANQVIYLPSGTYLIDTSVLPGLKNNYSIRGDGMGQTILKYGNSASSLAIWIGTPQFPGPGADQLITAGLEKGSTQFTVADASGFYDDFFVGLAPERPIWVKNISGPASTDYRTMKIGMRITSKTATTVDFSPPLPHDYSVYDDVRAIAWYGEPGHYVTEGVGIENLTLDISESISNIPVQIGRAWGCWMQDVEITGSNGRQVYIQQSQRLEFRRMYVNGVRSAGTNHEGIAFVDECYWNLVEDCIFYNGGAPPVIFGDAYGSCSSNVVAYCVAINTLGGFWDMSSNHAPHDMLNLFEGNFINTYKDDGYFGSSSHMTLLRNRIRSMIGLKHFSNYYNIVGNVLGSLVEIFNTDGTSQPANTAYSTETANYYPPVWPIYELGFPNIGNIDHDGTTIPYTDPPDYTPYGDTLIEVQQLDLNPKNTIIRHGNWDVITDGIVWDPGIADHDIPDSYFLSSAPSYFAAAGCPWPPFDPDYPDRGMTSIPAGVRLQALLSNPTITCETLNVTTLTLG